MAPSVQESSESEGGEKGSAAAMPEFEERDKRTLVAIVKECQKKGYEGTGGAWKPWVTANKMLAGFVCSMAEHPKRVKLVKRHKRHALQLRAEREEMRDGEETAASASPAEGSEWHGVKDLIDRCKKHPRFSTNYALPSCERGWRRVQRLRLDYGQSPRLVAIDCEMCVTDKEDKALVKVTAVDRDGVVLLDRLVRPAGTVKDWKTDITGITEDQLESVTYSRSDAQRELLKLLGSPSSTVIVGHSLHNDLRALRLDWAPVIDTALLFQFEKLPRATVGLAQLASALLKETIRADDSTHDSAEDARATMAIVHHTLAESPAGTIAPPDVKVEKGEQSKLMVYEMPKDTSPEVIRNLLNSEAAPVVDVAEELSSTQRKRMYVTFENPTHANAAFEALPGAQTTDSLGRFQKMVRLADDKGDTGKKEAKAVPVARSQKRKIVGGDAGVCIKVRKMAGHNGRMYGNDITGRREQQRQKQ